MNKNRLNFFWPLLLVAFCATTASGQTISVEKTTINAGAQNTLNINISGASNCIAVGFKLELPDGALNDADGSYRYDAMLDNQTAANHVVMSNRLDSKTLKFAIYSLTNEQLYSDSTSTSLLKVDIPAYGMKVGTYQGKIGDIELARKSKQLTKLSDVTLELNVQKESSVIDMRTDKTADDVWYDMNGRRYPVMPDRKGVYVRNGQKYVVR